MSDPVSRGNGVAPPMAGDAGQPGPAGDTGPVGGVRRRSPWPVAIVIGLILVAIVNLVFIVIAVRGGEPVVDSYSTGRR